MALNGSISRFRGDCFPHGRALGHAFAMFALLRAVGVYVTLGLGARRHFFGVALAHHFQWRVGQDMHVPGLSIHRRGRALGQRDDLVDCLARGTGSL